MGCPVVKAPYGLRSAGQVVDWQHVWTRGLSQPCRALGSCANKHRLWSKTGASAFGRRDWRPKGFANHAEATGEVGRVRDPKLQPVICSPYFRKPPTKGKPLGLSLSWHHGAQQRTSHWASEVSVDPSVGSRSNKSKLCPSNTPYSFTVCACGAQRLKAIRTLEAQDMVSELVCPGWHADGFHFIQPEQSILYW